MARTKTALATTAQPSADDDAIRGDLITFDQLTEHRVNAISRVNEEFGAQLPTFDLDVYARNINFLDAQAAEILMTQGIWLIAMKEALPHGQFQAELAQRTHISPRRASQYMLAARRLATNGGKAFLANEKLAADLTRTRLIELAINMPEEDLATLAEDGDVDGYTPEQYVSMSRADLMSVLRERDEAIAIGTAQHETLTRAHTKLTKAQKRERDADPHGARVKKFEKDMLDASGDAAQLVRVDMAKLVTSLHKTRDAEDDPLLLDAVLEDRVTLAIRQAFERTVTALRETAIALGVDPSALGIAGDEYSPAAL